MGNEEYGKRDPVIKDFAGPRSQLPQLIIAHIIQIQLLAALG